MYFVSIHYQIKTFAASNFTSFIPDIYLWRYFLLVLFIRGNFMTAKKTTWFVDRHIEKGNVSQVIRGHYKKNQLTAYCVRRKTGSYLIHLRASCERESASPSIERIFGLGVTSLGESRPPPSQRLKPTTTPNPQSPSNIRYLSQADAFIPNHNAYSTLPCNTTDQENTGTHTHHVPKSRQQPLLQIFVHRRANGRSWEK